MRPVTIGGKTYTTVRALHDAGYAFTQKPEFTTMEDVEAYYDHARKKNPGDKSIEPNYYADRNRYWSGRRFNSSDDALNEYDKVIGGTNALVDDTNSTITVRNRQGGLDVVPSATAEIASFKANTRNPNVKAFDSKEDHREQTEILENKAKRGVVPSSETRISSSGLKANTAGAIRQLEDGFNGQPVEVEKDEVVLNQNTDGSYTKVEDFQGGKTHEQGGEPYQLKATDIVIPANKRGDIDALMQSKDWKGIEKLRKTLPTTLPTSNELEQGVDEDPRKNIEAEREKYNQTLEEINAQSQTQTEQVPAVPERSKAEYPFKTLFPEDYWDKKRQTENERYQTNARREKRRGRLGALADVMRLVGDSVATHKGHNVYQNPYAGKLAESSYQALTNLDARNAAALSGIDAQEEGDKANTYNRRLQIEESDRVRQENQRNTDLNRIDAQKKYDAAIAKGDFDTALRIEQMFMSDDRMRDAAKERGADWNKRLEYDKEKHKLDLELIDRRAKATAGGKNNPEDDPEYIDIVSRMLLADEDIARKFMSGDATPETEQAYMDFFARKKEPQYQGISDDMGRPEMVRATTKRMAAIKKEMEDAKNAPKPTVSWNDNPYNPANIKNPSGAAITPTVVDQKKQEAIQQRKPVEDAAVVAAQESYNQGREVNPDGTEIQKSNSTAVQAVMNLTPNQAREQLDSTPDYGKGNPQDRDLRFALEARNSFTNAYSKDRSGKITGVKQMAISDLSKKIEAYLGAQSKMGYLKDAALDYMDMVKQEEGRTIDEYNALIEVKALLAREILMGNLPIENFISSINDGE